MQEEIRQIYLCDLPYDLVETLSGDNGLIMDFILGTRQVDLARKYGLTLTLLLGYKDINRQTVECQILLRGQPYWITLWLMEFSPRYP